MHIVRAGVGHVLADLFCCAWADLLDYVAHLDDALANWSGHCFNQPRALASQAVQARAVLILKNRLASPDRSKPRAFAVLSMMNRSRISATFISAFQLVDLGWLQFFIHGNRPAVINDLLVSFTVLNQGRCGGTVAVNLAFNNPNLFIAGAMRRYFYRSCHGFLSKVRPECRGRVGIGYRVFRS